MDRYIGLDAHASSCTVAVVGPSGRRLASHVVETSARALVAVVDAIPKTRHLCLEEGSLAGWLHEVLTPHVQEIVVTAVPQSRGPKNDKRDAFARQIAAITLALWRNEEVHDQAKVASEK